MRHERIDDGRCDARGRRPDALEASIAGAARDIAALVRTIAAALRRVSRTAIVWCRRVRERRQLLALDERVLRDIGLSRYDALHEGRKRFWQA
jgi:uncharacterized protein YjiS (DUF1127 family)